MVEHYLYCFYLSVEVHIVADRASAERRSPEFVVGLDAGARRNMKVNMTVGVGVEAHMVKSCSSTGSLPSTEQLPPKTVHR